MAWYVVVLLIIYFGICFLLMGSILIQSGKGGGLSSLGQSSAGIQDSIGATGAEKTMNKITTTIAVSFMLLAIVLSLIGSRGGGTGAEEIFPDSPLPAGSTAIPGAEPGQAAPGATVGAPITPATEVPIEVPVETAPAADAPAEPGAEPQAEVESIPAEPPV